MKINKQAQYGMLLALYLTKAGRSNLGYIAEGLNLSKSFVQQVARKLRLAGVIKSVRGKHGGYELVGEPLVLDILKTLMPVNLLTLKELNKYRTGSQEERALLLFTGNIANALRPVFTTKIKNLVPNLMATEENHFTRIQQDASIN